MVNASETSENQIQGQQKEGLHSIKIYEIYIYMKYMAVGNEGPPPYFFLLLFLHESLNFERAKHLSTGNNQSGADRGFWTRGVSM